MDLAARTQPGNEAQYRSRLPRARAASHGEVGCSGESFGFACAGARGISGHQGPRELHRRYGYDLVDGEYVERPDEVEIINYIRQLRTERATWQGIADSLNGLGVQPPSGAAWYPMTCRRICQREERVTSGISGA